MPLEGASYRLTNSADVFEMCPDGREGVAGGHTSCDFAENVRAGFYNCGMCHVFPAWSDVTDKQYEMICEGLYQAEFSDGEVLKTIHCYGGENAEVVIW